MPTEPDVLNYHYGAGALYFKADDIDVAERHLGNIPELTYTSEVTEEKHKQSMSGIKSTDFTYITELSATISATLEEITAENLALFVLGTVGTNTAGDKEVGGLTQTRIMGDLKYISDQPYGQTIEFYCRAQVRPNGDLSLIAEGLTNIPVQFEVLKDETTGNFGRWVIIEAEATA